MLFCGVDDRILETVHVGAVGWVAGHGYAIPKETRQLWDLATNRSLWSFIGTGRSTRAAAFSPDGRRIAVAGEDAVVRILDSGNGKELQTFKGHAGEVNAVVFLKDGAHIASGGRDGSILIWAVK